MRDVMQCNVDSGGLVDVGAGLTEAMLEGRSARLL